MGKTYYIGQPVIFVDALGERHDALVTQWWALSKDEKGVLSYGPPSAEWLAVNGAPGCNLVFVAPGGDRSDSYGRQIERSTSVVHKSRQPAPGMFWCWPSE
jgi:hypothetical protein